VQVRQADQQRRRDAQTREGEQVDLEMHDTERNESRKRIPVRWTVATENGMRNNIGGTASGENAAVGRGAQAREREQIHLSNNKKMVETCREKK
jgi:hypothetical protein